MYRDGVQRKHAFTQAPSTGVPYGSGQWPPCTTVSPTGRSDQQYAPSSRMLLWSSSHLSTWKIPNLASFQAQVSFLGGALLVFGSLASSELGQVMWVSISSPAT